MSYARAKRRLVRKIEQAVKYRAAGVRLAIVAEEHWVTALDQHPRRMLEEDED